MVFPGARGQARSVRGRSLSRHRQAHVNVCPHDAARADFPQARRLFARGTGRKKSSEIKRLPRPCRWHGGAAPRGEMQGQGVFHKVSLFIASPVAIGGLRAHSKSKSVVPVCRPSLTGRVVFSNPDPTLEKESLYEFDDQRSPS
jgi:hypothetical protein